METTRKPHPISWKRLTSIAPACADYCQLKRKIFALEQEINSNFVAAWKELGTVLSVKSTLLVHTPDGTRYNFRLGTAVSEKVLPQHKPALSRAYHEKDDILERAAVAKDANVRVIPNFTVAFPGFAPVEGVDADTVNKLLAATATTDVKLTLSWNEFAARFPISAPLLLKRNEVRVLSKQADELWTLASTQLEDLCPTLDATYQTTDTEGNVYTIAVFTNRHVELHKLPNNKQFIGELARAYQHITATMDSLRLKGLTTTKTTPFFSAYTY